MIRITGTFLDELPSGLPSQNWSTRDWEREFDSMREVGIDTVILVRGGHGLHAAFDSQVLNATMQTLPVYDDLLRLFLEQAERCRMTFYFGTYESGVYWAEGRYQEEIDINRAFADEVADHYADSSAFGGWYIAQAIEQIDDAMLDALERLTTHLRTLKDVPILTSPYFEGVRRSPGHRIDLDEHKSAWAPVFERLSRIVDVVAFADGRVSYKDLPRYLTVNHELAREHGLDSWSNLEAFDRDVHADLAPIDFRHLRYKMECAHESGAQKLITHAFSHFMSPNARDTSARNLSRRYRDWLEEQYYARHA